MKVVQGLLTLQSILVSVLFIGEFRIEGEIFLNKQCQYEDIVIKIDPNVRPGLNLRRVASQIHHLSSWMNRKTHRFSINKFSILLPDSDADKDFKFMWGDESLDDAQVKELHDESVANSASFVVVGQSQNMAYTVHLGGCGQEGEHIVISQSLMGNASIPRLQTGMLLLHEWAHYRWGIFDEYATEGDRVHPFYINDRRNISVTACPSQLKGWLLSKTAQNYTNCSLTEKGLPDKQCQFYLPYERNVKSSIMMGFGNGNEEFFCTKSGEVEHNSYAPNLHNLKCNGKSSWEVMKRHSDFSVDVKSCEVKMKTKDIQRYYTIMRRPKDRKNPTIKILIYKAGNLMRKIFNKTEQAVNCLQNLGKAIDLHIEWDNFTNTSQLSTFTKNKASKIFVLSDSWEADFSNYVKGIVRYLLNNVTMLKLKRSVKALPLSLPLSELIPALCNTVLTTLLPKEKSPRLVHRKTFQGGGAHGTFYIDAYCLKAVFIISTSKGGFEDGVLEDPQQKNCSTRNCTQFHLSDESLKVIKISSEDKPSNGSWTYRYTPNIKDALLTVLVFCVENKDMDKVLRIRSRVFREKEENTKGSKIFMATSVTQNEHPVAMATVNAIITDENGSEKVISLSDRGLGPDQSKDDGIYSGEFFDFGGNGLFSFSFRVETNETTKSLVYTKQGKEISPKNGFPQKPMWNYTFLKEKEEYEIRKEFGNPQSEFSPNQFLETNSTSTKQDFSIEKKSVPTLKHLTESFFVSMENYTSQDVYSPGKVTDLTVVEMSSTRSLVTLEWTSAGDDGFYGKATSIILKYSQQRSFYPSKFYKEGITVTDKDLVRKTTLLPKEAYEKHRIIVSIPRQNDSRFQEDTIYFFAMVVTDEVYNQGHVSNLAYAFFKPMEFNEEIQKVIESSSSGSTVLITIGAFGFGIVVFVVVVVCWRRRRQSVNYETHESEEDLHL